MFVMEMVPLGRHKVMSVVISVSVFMKRPQIPVRLGKGTSCGNGVLADVMQ